MRSLTACWSLASVRAIRREAFAGWPNNLTVVVASVLITVVVITTSPASAAPIVPPGYTVELFASGAGAVDGMSFAPSGDLFFTDYGGGRILRAQAPFQGGLNVFTVYASGIAFPTDLTFDQQGRLLVTSSTSNSSDVLQVFPDGHTSVFATGFSFPSSIAVYGSDVFVSGSGDGTIRRIDPAGNVHPFLAGYGNGDGPYGISFGATGNMYFTVHASGNIYTSDMLGNTQLLGSGSPSGVSFTAADPGGSLFISDALAADILRLDIPGSTSVFASGFAGMAHPPAIGPTDLVFDSAGSLYVGDGPNIWKISAPEPSTFCTSMMGLVTLLLPRLRKFRRTKT